MQDIIKFIQDRPLISINGLEKQCGIPQGTIRPSMRNIPKKYEDKIRKALMPYGLNQVWFIETIKNDIDKISKLIDDNDNIWDSRRK